MKKSIIFFVISALVINTISFGEIIGTNKEIKLNSKVVDEVTEKGEIDYFEIELDEPGSIQIDFEFDVHGEYIVKLIDIKNEKVIQNTTFSSSVNTSNGRYFKSANKMRVGEGDYQVQVSCNYWHFSDEEYELKINYEEEASDKYEKEFNNDARNAMIIDCNKLITGNLESTSDVDYYMVELPKQGEMYVEFTFDKNAKYTVNIYSEEDGSLNSILSNTFEAKLNQNSSTYVDTTNKLRVPKGNYYFKLTGGYGDSFSNEDYKFRVKFTSNSSGLYEEEYNNEANAATYLDVDCEIIGNLSSSSDVDFFVADIWNSNKFAVFMNIPEKSSYWVTTYKEVNGELSKINSEKIENKEEKVIVKGKTQKITAGRYYFKVTSGNFNNEDYVLSVSTHNLDTIVLTIDNPYMFINSEKVAVDGNRGTTPIIKNGRTLLPIKAVIEAMGGNVAWEESTRSVILNLNGNTVLLTLDSTVAYVNGIMRYLDVPAETINGRTMVPLKFVMDNFGANVIWNGDLREVTITY